MIGRDLGQPCHQGHDERLRYGLAEADRNWPVRVCDEQDRSGMNRWRFVCPMASRTRLTGSAVPNHWRRTGHRPGWFRPWRRVPLRIRRPLRSLPARRQPWKATSSSKFHHRALGEVHDLVEYDSRRNFCGGKHAAFSTGRFRLALLAHPKTLQQCGHGVAEAAILQLGIGQHRGTGPALAAHLDCLRCARGGTSSHAGLSKKSV